VDAAAVASAPDATLLLRCEQLTVGHRGRALLPPLSLEVRVGQTWAIIGPNGSGKTTLLRTLLGLQAALAGSIERPIGRSVGYVPQRSNLDPSVPARVLDLVRAGSERGWHFLDPRWPRRHRDAVERALRDTLTTPLANEPWTHLSEGQKQRVLMAQALAGEPGLLVLDEPTSAMDLHAERAVFQLLTRLQQQRGLGVLVVGHNLGLLASHASHLLFVDKDQGVALSGTVRDVSRSEAFRERYGLHALERVHDAH
jgi:zinc transport system ATP-binding protein